MRLRDRFPVLAYKVGKIIMIFSTLFYRKKPIKWTLKTYKRKYGYNLNLDNPRTFYEKMNYWKHFAYDSSQDQLTDKLKVKEVLNGAGYGNLCAKPYFHSKNIKEIKKWFLENKDTIERFVFKTNHGCGDVFIFNDGVITRKNGRKIKSMNQVFSILKTSLKFNHYYSRFEKNYFNLNPEIFVEEYISFNDDTTEFELMCNYGQIKYAHVVKNRQSNERKTRIVDDNFRFLGTYCGSFSDNEKQQVVKPVHLDDIKKFVYKFCSKYPFCRVDFIETNNKLVFCEFTFVKSGGIDVYEPRILDVDLGRLFKL